MIITLLKGSQALPVCPLDKDGMRYIPMNVNIQSQITYLIFQNDITRGEE
jgi:hypothetical protein